MRALHGALALTLAGGVAAAADSRSYVSGNFMLSLDGVSAGMVKKLEGGDVVPEGPKPSAGSKPRYTDIAFEVGANLPSSLRTLITTPKPANGALYAAGADGKVLREIDFTNALVSEVGFPALDGSSKDAAYMTIKLSPETVRSRAGDGSRLELGGSAPRASANAYRFTIDGLGVVRAARIGGFTLKPSARPPVVLHVLEADAAGVLKWQSDTQRSSGPALGRTASLEYLSEDLKTTLLAVRFDNVHLASAASEAQDRGDKVRSVRVELSVGRVRVD